MRLESHYEKEIIRILSSIFPGALIYYSEIRGHEASQDGKLPEVDILLDTGRRIGNPDIEQAQRALAETDIPYTVYLYDVNGISEAERRNFFRKSTSLKL